MPITLVRRDTTPLPDTDTMKTTKTRRHYAMEWWMNAVHAHSGVRYAAYYSFPSAAARDAWVENGAPYRGSGFREALPASDTELRAALRRDDIQGCFGLRVERK